MDIQLFTHWSRPIVMTCSKVPWDRQHHNFWLWVTKSIITILEFSCVVMTIFGHSLISSAIDHIWLQFDQSGCFIPHLERKWKPWNEQLLVIISLAKHWLWICKRDAENRLVISTPGYWILAGSLTIKPRGPLGRYISSILVHVQSQGCLARP